MRIRSRRLASPLAVLLVAVVAGCTTAPPSAVPTDTPAGSGAESVAPAASGPAASGLDPATVYAAIRTQVESIRGLQPKNDVPPVVIDETQLRANLEADYDRTNTPAVLDASQRELIALGLLASGSSLRALVLDLDSGQVAGYYSPHDKKLFVVSRSGGIGPTQETTYAHEFTHQLQDQNFDLDSLKLDATDQGDRSIGRLALVEGDAVATQTAWMTSELTAADLGQILADASDPAALAALGRAPAFLRETSFFPYQDGLAFVQRLMATGGEAAVNAAFGAPPDSTEQILHPEKYLTREVPVVVTLPGDLAGRLGSGWTVAAQDTIGELMLRIWLEQGGVSATIATDAAAGWGGDRLVLLEGPAGADVLAIETTWDSPADAAAFATAAASALTGLHLGGQVVHTPGSSRVSLAIGANVSGLAAVLPG